MATSRKATTRRMMLGKTHLFYPRCLQVCSTMYTSGSWAAWAQLKFGIKLGPPSFRKGKRAIFVGVAQSFWRVSWCRTDDCTPLRPHQQLALAGAPGPEQCCRGVQACTHACARMHVCGSAWKSCSRIERRKITEWRPGTLWVLRRLRWHQSLCTAGGATAPSRAGGWWGRNWRGASNTQAQIRNICVVPRVRLVGCRLVGETDPCSLHAPSQREEEPVPQAGGQMHEPFESNAGHSALAAVSPTAFRSHPDLIKSTGRRKYPCQINYVRPNWRQQVPRSTGLEKRALPGWPSLAKSITLCSSYSGRSFCHPAPGTSSCCTTGKEPPQAPTKPALPGNPCAAPLSWQGAELDPGCGNWSKVMLHQHLRKNKRNTYTFY